MEALLVLAILPFALYGAFLWFSLILVVLGFILTPFAWLFSSPKKDEEEFDMYKYHRND
jgi:hypothetical protein